MNVFTLCVYIFLSNASASVDFDKQKWKLIQILKTDLLEASVFEEVCKRLLISDMKLLLLFKLITSQSKALKWILRSPKALCHTAPNIKFYSNFNKKVPFSTKVECLVIIQI